MIQRFPGIQEEEALLASRISVHGKDGHDDALDSFLRLLRFLRRLLLHYAADLCLRFQGLTSFTFHPFKTPEFHTFALDMRKAIQLADLSARQKSITCLGNSAKHSKGLLQYHLSGRSRLVLASTTWSARSKSRSS